MNIMSLIARRLPPYWSGGMPKRQPHAESVILLQAGGVGGFGGPKDWRTEGWCELDVFVQVPVLQSEGEALVVEQFGVKLVLSVGGIKDQIVVEIELVAVELGPAFGVAVGNGADFKKK